MIRKLLLTLVILFYCTQASVSQNNTFVYLTNDSTSYISVLTSYPNKEAVYTVYGHSAMRVCDPTLGLDLVFNYGIFDFNSPNFTYRFMTGETDYWVACINYEYYIHEYKERGVKVCEQKLNLTPNEKQKVWRYLFDNIKEENKVYRYNIFFDNCTTKLADILEENMDGKLLYPKNVDSKTFRDLLHEHLQIVPWLQFGIDIIIGSDADNVMTDREMLFLPIYEHKIFNDTQIVDSNRHASPLVNSDTVILSAKEKKKDTTFFSPMLVGIFVLILIIVTGYGMLRKQCKLCNTFHFMLLLIAGIMGSIVFFMMCFSMHPATSSNWNIVWLHPLQLVAAFLFLVKKPLKYMYYYHFINFVVLSLFLLAWSLVPQQLEIAFIPFILSLWAISGVQILKYKS